MNSTHAFNPVTYNFEDAENLIDTFNDDIAKVIVKTSLFIFNEYAAVGGMCSLLALLLAGHQIFMHLSFFNEPKLQLYIVRILLMVPVYIDNIIMFNLLDLFYSKLVITVHA